MERHPIEIKREGSDGLAIKWSDGTAHHLSSEYLRSNCPCATCKEARGDESHSKPLTAKKRSLKVLKSTKDEQIALERIWGVGQYAIGIEWGDKHSSGIYTFRYLSELAERSS